MSLRIFLLFVYTLTLAGCVDNKVIDEHTPTPEGYVKTSDGSKFFFTKIPDRPWPEIDFPFSSNHPVHCTQGNMAPYPRSHFYCNTLFALDFSSPFNSPAGEIYSVFKGKAFVLNDCQHSRSNESNAYNNCTCNGGYGNAVRIAQPDGTYALYAHLSEIYIENGQEVGKGTLIGREGISGAAGCRHLHLALYKTESPDDLTHYLNPGTALPFIIRLKYLDRPTAESVPSTEIRCHKLFEAAPLLHGMIDYGVEEK